MKKLPLSFYRKDAIEISKALLGKSLFTCIDADLTGGIIIETEAYTGIHDRASHSYNNRRTPRTEVMYKAGGVAYVYLCYGIHHLLNVITGEEGTPQGVLIRAICPTHGIETMRQRRNNAKNLATGPGALTAALGVTLDQYGMRLDSKTIWIADNDLSIDPAQIIAGPRIGVDYAGEDALLPYRFRISI